MSDPITLISISKRFDLGISPPDVDDFSLIDISSLAIASAQHVSFLSNKKYLSQAQNSNAGAIISQYPIEGKVCLLSEDPYLTYSEVAQYFHPRACAQGQCIHPSAIIDDSVQLPHNITIEAGVVIGERCVLGEHCVIQANAVLQKYVILKTHTIVSPHVTIHDHCEIGGHSLIGAGTVIGSDGFGYASRKTDKAWSKIPQIGKVIIGDYVEIGSNCSIDRGAIQNTIIEDHVIIDNLVHIAHNVTIGRATAIAGQGGIAGSTSIGENCQFSGQIGITGHINITDEVVIMGKSLVSKSITRPGVYSGLPCQPIDEWRKNTVTNRNIAKHIAYLKKQNTTSHDL